MNIPLLDPFERSQFPEVIEDIMEDAFSTLLAFNRRGTLVAVGQGDGLIRVWDFMTRGPATTLAGHSRPLSSVCWSRNGRKLLTSSHDRLLLLWDVETGRLQHRTEFESPVACACLHPTDKYVALACTTSSRPVVVDYRQADEAAEATPAGARTELGSADGASGDGSATAAVFSKDGAQIYVGDAKGNITVFDTATRGVLRSLTVGSGSLIRSISFNRSGQHFLTNSNDRTIRLFDSSSNECVREFRDVVNQMRWKKVCFSCDGDHILGGSQEDAKHNLYIWSTDGQLRKILEGPKEGVVDLAWHPMRPIIASCSTSGCIFIWATNHTENWSAFAPDFKELEENEEYEEREDEFDVVVEGDDQPRERQRQLEEDAEVDILTIDRVGEYSSDDDDDELFFLPTVPIHDDAAAPAAGALGAGPPLPSALGAGAPPMLGGGAQPKAQKKGAKAPKRRKKG